jgi:hypothetical protein
MTNTSLGTRTMRAFLLLPFLLPHRVEEGIVMNEVSFYGDPTIEFLTLCRCCREV